MPKFHHCEQGSEEWMRLRLGIPTASAFDKIITTEGKPSTQRDKYLKTLLAEYIMGVPVQEVTTALMQRGREMEHQAVQKYELVNVVDTERIGFVTTDDGLIGASPDRLVGDDGMLEIKCPTPTVHVEYLLAGVGASKAYKAQVQGQLMVTEREWSDTLSYCPAMPDALYRVTPDEKYIKTMRELLANFVMDLLALRELADSRGWRQAVAAGETADATDWLAELGVSMEDLPA